MEALKSIAIFVAFVVVATSDGSCLSWRNIGSEGVKEIAGMDDCREQLNGRVFTIQPLGSDSYLTADDDGNVDLLPAGSASNYDVRWRSHCHPRTPAICLESVRYQGKFIFYSTKFELSSDSAFAKLVCSDCHSLTDCEFFSSWRLGVFYLLSSGTGHKWNITIDRDQPIQVSFRCQRYCASQLIGKTVQFESNSRPDNYLNKAFKAPRNWENVEADNAKNRSNGFSWRVHPARAKGSVYLENLAPNLKRHFMFNYGNQLKYFGHNDRLHTNYMVNEIMIICSDCGNGIDCAISSFEGQLFEDKVNVRFIGRPNGDEMVTVWQNSNCSPSGQTLAFEVTYEEGAIDSSKMSSSHSIVSRFGILGKAEFNASVARGLHISYNYDWSSSTQIMKQARTSKTITVKIPPGQKAALKQWRGQFGDLEVKSTVEYVAEYCPVEVPAAAVAIDKDQRIFHRPNCSPGNPEISVKISYNKGISVIGNTWNHAEVISAANPEVIKAIEIAIRKSENLNRKNDWMEMDLKYHAGIFEKNLEYSNACTGLSVPPGKVLSVYQLVLTYGPYIVYSNKIWPVYTDCI